MWPQLLRTEPQVGPFCGICVFQNLLILNHFLKLAWYSTNSYGIWHEYFPRPEPTIYHCIVTFQWEMCSQGKLFLFFLCCFFWGETIYNTALEKVLEGLTFCWKWIGGFPYWGGGYFDSVSLHWNKLSFMRSYPCRLYYVWKLELDFANFYHRILQFQ